MHSNEEAISSPSPSFNSYFNTDLAQVVARVAAEFVTFNDDFFLSNAQNEEIRSEQGEDLEDDGDFEFNLSFPSDEEVRPVYPVFDRDLLRDYDLVGEVDSRSPDHEEEFISRSQIQLKNLFLEDGEANRPSFSSSSSEEEDEMEDIPDETYCLWMPNKSRLASPGRCTKSNSTGSSASVTEKVKAWKLRDLLKRSKSDGKDRNGMILLTPKKKAAKRTAALDGYLIGRSRAAAENNRRTYLPYRQDLMGFSVTPRAFRKMNLLPFS